MTTVVARLTRGTVLLTLLTSFMIGAFVKVALGNHYHSTNGISHGFVHGSSMTDGSFFARVESGTAPRSCQIDSISNPGGYRTLTYGDYTTTCNLWSLSIWQSATECLYRADNYAGSSSLSLGFGWHVNRPDNYCG